MWRTSSFLPLTCSNSFGKRSRFLSWVGYAQNSSLYITLTSAGEAPPTEDGFIEPTKAIEDVRQEPYPLPKDFEWCILDINDPKQVCFLLGSLMALLIRDVDQGSVRLIIAELCRRRRSRLPLSIQR